MDSNPRNMPSAPPMISWEGRRVAVPDLSAGVSEVWDGTMPSLPSLEYVLPSHPVSRPALWRGRSLDDERVVGAGVRNQRDPRVHGRHEPAGRPAQGGVAVDRP